MKNKLQQLLVKPLSILPPPEESGIPLKINSFCGADLLVGNKVSGNLIANNNIGVGTDVPLQKLHIMSGSILVTDTIDTQNACRR